jgi:Reverse transcriptase (RNA-dependent DNA polymerase)
LLNCVFKIISKAVDTRLEKISDIILSRAQKGFTKQRYIQECLINITESIAYCEDTGTAGFILAIDMAKAFDTVKHDYMMLVYKFLGIGNKFASILETISTKRTASILKEDGSLTEPFNLGTGFPQGNNPSPKQFNVCGQPLIFKIEFNPAILPIEWLRNEVGPDPDPHMEPAVPDPVQGALLPVPVAVADRNGNDNVLQNGPRPAAVIVPNMAPDPDPPNPAPIRNILPIIDQNYPIDVPAVPDPGPVPVQIINFNMQGPQEPDPVPVPVRRNFNANLIRAELFPNIAHEPEPPDPPPGRNQMPLVAHHNYNVVGAAPVPANAPEPEPPPGAVIERNPAPPIANNNLNDMRAVPDPGLDPEPDPNANLNNHVSIRKYGVPENKLKSGKVEAFADDNTVMGKNSPQAINAIKSNLADFAVLSGLKCNVDKSMIMVVGTGGQIPDYIANSGFKVTETLHILGVDITRNFDNLVKNFDKIIEKIKKVGNFWHRYRLSLIGRINVVKTLMLSQLSYIGSFLSPSNEQLTNMLPVVNDFISSNLRLSKKFINTSVQKGSIGMINLNQFITGIQFSWIKLSFKSDIDIWRKSINNCSKGNVLTAASSDLNHRQNPVTCGILRSFESFKAEFYKQNDNFMAGYVKGNPFLVKSRINNSLLNVDFIMNSPQDNSFLQINQLLTEARNLLPKPELQVVIGSAVTDPDYQALNPLVPSRQICAAYN